VRDEANVPASAATVTLHWPDGQIILLEDPVGTGIFQIPSGEELPWAEAYGLSIERGEDYLDKITITSPTLHEITSPDRFYNHYALQPLDVEWTGGDTAEEYRVVTQTNGFDSNWIEGDPGLFRIEGPNFAQAGGAYMESVTVRRRKALELTGALPQSSLTLEVLQEVDPIAVNPPAVR
jgi:hypothetical protein